MVSHHANSLCTAITSLPPTLFPALLLLLYLLVFGSELHRVRLLWNLSGSGFWEGVGKEINCVLFCFCFFLKSYLAVSILESAKKPPHDIFVFFFVFFLARILARPYEKEGEHA